MRRPTTAEPIEIRDVDLIRVMSARLDDITRLAWKIGRQRDRWYRVWKWTFGALLVSMIGHIGWILAKIF